MRKTVVCCGLERMTNFCPNCGTKLETIDLRYDLLHHVQKNLDKHLKGLEVVTSESHMTQVCQSARYVKRIAEGERHVRNEIKRCQQMVDRWTAWRDWVKASIVAEDNTHSLVDALRNVEINETDN
jgi:hypothetical protein